MDRQGSQPPDGKTPCSRHILLTSSTAPLRANARSLSAEAFPIPPKVLYLVLATLTQNIYTGLLKFTMKFTHSNSSGKRLKVLAWSHMKSL